MPRAVPILTGIPAAELRPRAKIETDGRASRRMLALLLPCSPELNAVERLWLYLKKFFLSHRGWPDYDAMVDAVCNSWLRVTVDTERINSLFST